VPLDALNGPVGPVQLVLEAKFAFVGCPLAPVGDLLALPQPMLTLVETTVALLAGGVSSRSREPTSHC